MRLRTALTITIFAAAATAALTSFAASWWIGGELVNVSINEQLSSDMSQFRLQIEREADRAQALAQFVSSSPDIVEAFAAQDRNRLLALAEPGFQQAREHGVAQFHFHTPPAVSFLRVHAPNKFGDDISDHRHMVIAANLTHKLVRGVEIGVGGLGIRAVAPVTYRGRHVGTVEFGMSLGQDFLKRYHDHTGKDTAIFLKKDNALTQLASTLPQGLPLAPAELDAALAGKNLILASYPAGDYDYALTIQPLHDFSDAAIGVLVLAVARSSLDAVQDSAVKVFAGLGLLVLGVGGFSAWRINRDLGTPLAAMTRNMSDLAAGHLDVEIDASWKIVEMRSMAQALHIFAQAMAAKDKNERQTKLAKARFEALVETTAELVWAKNAKGEVEEDSPSWRAFTGLSFADYKGMGWVNAIHPDDREAVQAHWRRSLEDLTPYSAEYRLRHADGGWRWTVAKAAPLLDESGAAREWIGMNTDVNEHKEAECVLQRVNRALLTLGSGNEALMRAENEHELLLNMCRTLVEVGGHRIAWIGLTHEKTRNVKPDACIGLPDNSKAEEILCPVAGRSKRPSGVAMATGKTQINRDIDADPSFETCRAKLQEFGVKAIASFPLVKDGGVFGVCAVYSTDVKAFDADEIKLLEQLTADLAYGIQSLRAGVERKANMEQLHAAAHYIRSLFEASLDIFVTVGPDGAVADINRASEHILGVPPQQAIGRDFASFFTDPEKARAGLRDAFINGSISDLSLSIRHPSGRLASLLCNASVFRDQHATVVGVFAAGRDVTELERVQHELQAHHERLEELVDRRTADLAKANGSLAKANDSLAEANKKLQVSNEEMEAFSYSVSHDLRVPLRAVDGFSHILLEDYKDKLDEDGQRLLGVVRDNAIKMGVLIDDILAFSRVGRVPMKLTPIDMEAMVRSTLAELESVTAGRQITFKIARLPSAEADAAMIQRVWTNLLDNAVKYTSRQPAAVIEVGYTSNDEETIYFVKDNGAGFDMKHTSRLFGVFQRLHGQEFPGTGIGLANVKRIISRHHGRVWAEGCPGEGAVFYFTLPNQQDSISLPTS
jgi:PAS domain S-box-containing protein